MHHAKLPFGRFAHGPDVVRPSKITGNRHTNVLHRLAGDNYRWPLTVRLMAGQVSMSSLVKKLASFPEKKSN